MKKWSLLIGLLLSVLSQVTAQVRIVSVSPQEDKFVLKNFSDIPEDISALRLCALLKYASVKSLNANTDIVLQPGESTELTWNLNDVDSDLGLYTASGSFGSAANILDFVQYGAANNGRENVAVAAGIWVDDDFVASNEKIYFSGEATDHDVSFWSTSPELMILFTQTEDPSCPSANDGSLRISVTSGTPNYTFEWSNGATTANTSSQSNTISGLVAGTYSVTVTDINGKTDSESFTLVAKEDVTNPSIEAVDNQSLEVDDQCEATLPDYTGLAVVSDNCDASPSVIQEPVAGTTISGTTTVELKVMDASGNFNSVSFEVVLEDNTLPEITCPADIMVETSEATAVVDYDEILVSDNCTISELTQIAGLGDGEEFPMGTTTETYLVTDMAGNEASCSFDVTVDIIASTKLEHANQELAPYPNPVQGDDLLHVDIEQGEHVALFSAQGIKLAESTNGSLSTQELEPGIYILTLYRKDGQSTSTSVVVH